MTVKIVLGIIEWQDKVLIGKVRLEKLSEYGQLPYVFPGGRVKVDEAEKTALTREIKEETGLSVTVESLIDTRSHPKTHHSTSYFYCPAKTGSVKVNSATNDDLEKLFWTNKRDLLTYLPTLNPKVLLFLAAKTIAAGGIVVHPTDTCYGLATNAQSPLALKKLHRLKDRVPQKPFIVCVRDLAMAKKLVKFNPLAEKLFAKFLPGPLTLVLPKKKGVGTLAIRMPNHPITLALSRLCPVPYTTTSANFSGGPNPYRVAEISKEILDSCDLIIDAGELSRTPPSTVVEVTSGELNVLRVGPVSKRQLQKVAVQS